MYRKIMHNTLQIPVILLKLLFDNHFDYDNLSVVSVTISFIHTASLNHWQINPKKWKLPTHDHLDKFCKKNNNSITIINNKRFEKLKSRQIYMAIRYEHK